MTERLIRGYGDRALASELARVVAQALRVPEELVETPGLAFGTLASWDSMARIELIVSLEDHYGIELDQAEIAALESLEDVREMLARRSGSS